MTLPRVHGPHFDPNLRGISIVSDTAMDFHVYIFKDLFIY